MTRWARQKRYMKMDAGDSSPIARAATAKDAKLDCALVEVNREAYQAFIARLDVPLSPSDQLKRTLQSRAPWE